MMSSLIIYLGSFPDSTEYNEFTLRVKPLSDAIRLFSWQQGQGSNGDDDKEAVAVGIRRPWSRDTNEAGDWMNGELLMHLSIPVENWRFKI